MQATASASTSDLVQLSELINTIYEGATEPSRWEAILPAIADWIGAQKGLLFTPLNAPDNNGFYFTHAIPESVMQLWGARYAAQDIWATRSMERGLLYEGNIIVGDDEVPFEELKRSEFYQELLVKHDVAHLLSGIVFGLNSPQSNPYVVCTLLRGVDSGRFTHSERDRLSILVPHLSRSLGVMTRLRDLELKAAASLAALDRLSVGILLFGARGSVAFANRAACKTLEQDDGLRWQHRYGDSSLGDVITRDAVSQDALTSAIRSAVAPDLIHAVHFSRSVSVPRPSGRQDYTLNFSSLAAHNEFGSGSDAPRAIVFITDNAEPIKLDGELFRKSYGLTPAEVRLAETLAECLTVEETAKRLGVSKHTVKTQLQSIYTKTNTNNRAKLMRLIVSLAQLA